MKISQVGKAIYSELDEGSQPPSHGFCQRLKGRVGKLYSRKMGRLRVCLDFKVAGTRKL